MAKILAIGCGVFVLLTVILISVVPAFMDDHFNAEVKQVMKAKPAETYTLVADLEAWQKWCSWNAESLPQMKSTYTGGPGVGAEWAWTDPSGNGRMVITSADPAKGITYDMFFADFPKSEGHITFTESASGLEVSMGLKGKVNWLGRFACSAIEASMAKQFNEGLTKLKGLVENGQTTGAAETPK